MTVRAVADSQQVEPSDLDRDLERLRAVRRDLERVGQVDSLAERLRQCADAARQVDEFCRIRSARHLELEEAAFAGQIDGPTSVEQLAEIRALVQDLAAIQDELFVADLGPGLAEAGIQLIEWDELEAGEQASLSTWFDRRVFPVLTPLAVDPGHPFPYISDLSLNLAVVVGDRRDGRRHFARLKVPGSFARFVQVPGAARFVPFEQVIIAHLDRLFPGMVVWERHAFRITRDGGANPSALDHAGRRLAGRPVRLEVQQTMTADVQHRLQRELELDDDAVTTSLAPLDLAWLTSVAELVDDTSPEAPQDSDVRRQWVTRVAAALLVAVVLLVAAVLLVVLS